MDNLIVCFEGPSGIGKTTMGHLLSADYNIVPEVNLLFERPENEAPFWYLERQLDRYNRCKKSNQHSILDGDIFQPVWYNWANHYPPQFLSKKETHHFYRTKLSEGKIAFPDLYVIFEVEEQELWIRKAKDKTRERRNFEKHLKIIEPLKRYYKFLEEETEIELRFIPYDKMETTRQEVLSAIADTNKKNIDSFKAFEQIERWVNQHLPACHS